MNLKGSVFSILILFCTFLNAQAGTISDLKFIGLKKTKTSLIKKLIAVQSGMQLDSILLEKDITRLKRLPSISHAYYQVFLEQDGSYEITYAVEENFTLIPFANLFSSANDDFAFRIGLQEFNFLGSNITVGGFYQLDNFNSYGFSIRAPYLFSKKLGLAFNYNDFNTQEPVFFSDDTADYKYSNTGFELLGLYEFDFKNRMELGFSLFTEDYNYLSGATQPNVPLALNVDKHLFKLIYDYDDIDYFYHYLDGFRSNLNFQYVGSSDAALPEFLIGFNDFIYYKRVGNRGNWANRLRLGLASNVNSPFAPFTVHLKN
jgi:outer membrane protein assembly factor BamA